MAGAWAGHTGISGKLLESIQTGDSPVCAYQNENQIFTGARGAANANSAMSRNRAQHSATTCNSNAPTILCCVQYFRNHYYTSTYHNGQCNLQGRHAGEETRGSWGRRDGGPDTRCSGALSALTPSPVQVHPTQRWQPVRFAPGV
jgi:hypothetical protein